MTFSVTVPCRDIDESKERSDWAKDRGIDIIARTWEVVNRRQHITLEFEKEADAIFFALRWS